MCNWTEELQPDGDCAWQTECENMFVFTADGPKENDFNYCPYCGDVLHVKAAVSSEGACQ
jgi:hypothetical protein